MTYKNLLLEIRNGIVFITFNQPDQMNPLDWTTVKELKSCIELLENDPAVRVIVITGKGRAFAAGANMRECIDLYKHPKRYRQFLIDFSDLFNRIERSPKIFIAAVNGYCLAGGIAFLLSCDLVVAAEEAQIGDVHVNYAQPPAAGISQRLPRMIDTLRAKYLFLTGEQINGREAERIGLVSQVVPADKLMVEVEELAKKILSKSPAALKCMKYLVNEGRKLDLKAALEMELNYVHNYATTSEDAMEGLIAFSEKRKPQFKGT